MVIATEVYSLTPLQQQQHQYQKYFLVASMPWICKGVFR